MNTKRFINPYTFVTLGDKCDKSINIKELTEKSKELLTGYIDCTLENLTELFIPDTSKEPDLQSNGHTTMEFNKIDGKPVIPGSSIRGVIRSVFETITNSCLSTTSDDSFLHKRYSDPGVPGVLGREGKKIILYRNANQNLTKVYLNSVNHLDDLIRVTHEKDGKVHHNPKGDHILFKGEPSPRKKKAGIFKKGQAIRSLDDKELKRFETMLDLYAESSGRTQNKRNRHSGYSKYRRLFDQLKKGQDHLLPVYYKEINGVYYISPAAISKEVFNHTIKDLLALNGQYEPCDDIEHLCPACSLFGKTHLKKNKTTTAIGSRVRFTDATVETQKPYFVEPKVLLKEMGGPKTSAIEFYMFQPELAERYEAYNYDYVFTWDQNKKKQAKYAVKVPYKPKIRGRKFYWHHLNFKLSEAMDRVPHNRNITAEVLKRNHRFTFRVYFDRVTKDELTRLLWALDFDNVHIDTNSYFKHKRAHKMGMGKPLGLGSTEIIVNDIVIRQLVCQENKIQYEMRSLDRLSFQPLTVSFESPVYIRELFEIMSYYDENEEGPMAKRRKGIPVRYPFVVAEKGYYPKSKNALANHQWFNLNRGESVKEVIQKTLPIVGFTSERNRDDLSLEAYEVKDKSKKHHHKNNNRNNNHRNNRSSFASKQKEKNFFKEDNPFNVLSKLKK